MADCEACIQAGVRLPAPATHRLTFWPHDDPERSKTDVKALEPLSLCDYHRDNFARNWLADGGDMALVETEKL